MGKPTRDEHPEMFCDCCWKLDSLYEEYAKSLGYSYSNLYVLQIVYANPGTCTQKMICEWTFLPKQTVNVIITGFLKQGFIEMKELTSDRRVKIISLTKSGKKFADKHLLKMQNAQCKAMEQLTPQEQKALIENFVKFKELLRGYLFQQ